MIFLASPGSALHAHLVREQPVLMSFGCWKPFLRGWLPSFGSLMLDSGAFSEFNTGKAIDHEAYIEWAQSIPFAVACAALDDILGDTDRTLRNAARFGFPTFHEADPMESLPDFIALAKERGWLGIGMTPPRAGKSGWLRSVCEQIPDGIHVHGFALVSYYDSEPRLDSADSTTWWRDAMALKSRNKALAHLTMGECLEIKIKQYARATKTRGTPEE